MEKEQIISIYGPALDRIIALSKSPSLDDISIVLERKDGEFNVRFEAWAHSARHKASTIGELLEKVLTFDRRKLKIEQAKLRITKLQTEIEEFIKEVQS